MNTREAIDIIRKKGLEIMKWERVEGSNNFMFSVYNKKYFYESIDKNIWPKPEFVCSERELIKGALYWNKNDKESKKEEKNFSE